MSRPTSLPTTRYVFDRAEAAPVEREPYCIDDETNYGGGLDASSQCVAGQPLTLGGLLVAILVAWALYGLISSCITLWQERPTAPAYAATETRLRCLECGDQIRSISDPTGSGVCRVCRGASELRRRAQVGTSGQVARVQWGAR